MRRVIGLDPGTARTGYAILDEDEQGTLAVVTFGVIETPPEETLPQRLLLLYEQVRQLLLLHQPQSGAVEKLFFQRNVSTAIQVGQARGVILLALAEAGIPVAEYTPNEIKQSVSGYGSADKRQMQEMVRLLLGLSSRPQPDDAADALAVAITHLNWKTF
ncbi:MAG: crossover junction endodeoxyribonuclease RuvC [Anaerolineales bacterium]